MEITKPRAQSWIWPNSETELKSRAINNPAKTITVEIPEYRVIIQQTTIRIREGKINRARSDLTAEIQNNDPWTWVIN